MRLSRSASKLRPIVGDLCARQANLQREAHAKLAAEIPAEQGYRAAVAEMAGGAWSVALADRQHSGI
jgi:hypothetical protein